MRQKVLDLMKRAKEMLEEYCYLYKALICLFVVYLIGNSSIIRANYNYIDDMARVNEGYAGWENFSRYTSVFLSKFVHADNYLMDISPLPQIIAVLFLTVSAILVIHLLGGGYGRKSYR